MMLAQSGRGRGVLALKSWEPLRKPGANSNVKSKENGNKSTSGQNVPQPPYSTSTLLAKYNYQSNPNQPGGFPELTLKQGQKVEFLNVHPEQALWWNVKEEGGSTGYAPASFMMIMENKPSNLPWLENKRLEEKQEEKLENGALGDAPEKTWKPYVSAYGGGPTTAPPGVAAGQSQERKYYCGVCDKQLNGPKPYQAHMVSKAHKEEVEAQSYNE